METNAAIVRPIPSRIGTRFDADGTSSSTQYCHAVSMASHSCGIAPEVEVGQSGRNGTGVFGGPRKSMAEMEEHSKRLLELAARARDLARAADSLPGELGSLEALFARPLSETSK